MDEAKKLIHQIVIQPTAFCNINCKYCYLPNRDLKSQISPLIVKTLFNKLSEGKYLNETIDIRWHAGEPLAVHIELYEECLELIKDIVGSEISIEYSIQTNGLLINERWCDLFKKYKFKVGVSVDGTKHIHDRNRVNRKGVGTFDEAFRKIELLKREGVDFTVISVLTDYSLDFADEIYTFFKSINPALLAFNVEETEGINISKSFSKNDFMVRYGNFMQSIYNLQKNDFLKVREFEDIKNFIFFGKGNRYNVMTEPLNILTIDWNGNVSTFSPELISYSDYVFGNIMNDKIEEILQNENLKRVYSEIKCGVSDCEKECEYYSVCGGGAPSNKLWENKSFNSTTTLYCTARFKIITDIIVNDLEKNAK